MAVIVTIFCILVFLVVLAGLGVLYARSENKNIKLYVDLQNANALAQEALQQQHIYERALGLPSRDFQAKEEELLSRAADNDEVAQEILFLTFKREIDRELLSA